MVGLNGHRKVDTGNSVHSMLFHALAEKSKTNSSKSK